MEENAEFVLTINKDID